MTGPAALEPGPDAPPPEVDPGLFWDLVRYSQELLTVTTYDRRTQSEDPAPFQALIAEDPGLLARTSPTDSSEEWIVWLGMFDRDTVRLLDQPRSSGTWRTSVGTDADGAATVVVSWGGVVMYAVEHPDTHEEAVVALEREVTWSYRLDGSSGTHELFVNPDGIDLCASFDENALVVDYSKPVDMTSYAIPPEQFGRRDRDASGNLAARVAECRIDSTSTGVDRRQAP